jgi:ABC-type transport system involved in cytochrome c biogenesis permease component
MVATALRRLVVGAWIAALMLSPEISTQDAVLLTLLCGVVVGRWWVLAAPPAWAVAVIGWLVVANPDHSELTRGGEAILAVLFATIAIVVLAVGVGLRRALDAGIAWSKRERAPA